MYRLIEDTIEYQNLKDFKNIHLKSFSWWKKYRLSRNQGAISMHEVTRLLRRYAPRNDDFKNRTVQGEGENFKMTYPKAQ